MQVDPEGIQTKPTPQPKQLCKEKYHSRNQAKVCYLT